MTTATDWQTRVGGVWAQEWRRTERALFGLAPYLDRAILAAASPGPFTALDIGSGAGSTAMALADARPDATITGVDLSPALAAVAQGRAGGRTNFRFIVGDALNAAAERAPLDLLVSRHGVMFFPDPAAAFASLARAAAPGGRLVFSCFSAVVDNPWATLVTPRPATSTSYVPGPFAFGDQARAAAFLTQAGWQDAKAQLVRFAYRVGEGDDPVADAVDFLSRIGPATSALRDAAPADRAGLIARLRSALDAQRTGAMVELPAAAWIWTARAAGDSA